MRTRNVGLACIVFGAVFLGLNYFTLIKWGNYYPSLMFMGSVITSGGFGLVIAPGPDVVAEEVAHDQFLKELFRRSSTFHKVVWVLFILLGISIFVSGMIHFGLDF